MKTDNKSESVKRISELDALRGIAAFAVMFHHFSKLDQAIPLNSVLIYGRFGVQLFFIISGYVIFMSLSKVNTINEFTISRIARLYPGYWISVIATTIVITVFHPNYHGYLLTSKSILLNLTMFQHWFLIPDIDGVYWTLAIELCFYILMGLIFKLGKINQILNIGITIIVLMPLIQFIKNKYNLPIYYLFPLLNYFNLFFIGIIFFNYTTLKNKILFHTLIVYCVIVHFLMHGMVEGLGVLIVTIIFYLFHFKILSFLKNNILLFLGKISYSLYLIHEVISDIIFKNLLPNDLNISFKVMIVTSCSIIIASLITHFIEIPIGKKLKSFLLVRFAN